MAFNVALWNEHASTCRCVLELAHRIQRRRLDPAEFVAVHLKQYPHWTETPGRADLLVVGELVRELDLARTVKTSVDPDQIIRDAAQPGYVGAFLFLERWPGADDPRRLELVEHCVLATQFDEKFFQVWNPFQDGTATESPWSWKSWSKLMMHALVLSR